MSIVVRHFESAANSKDRRRKVLCFVLSIVYKNKLSGFTSFRIRRSNFKFRTQNLRRHDQRRNVLLRIRLRVRNKRNESGSISTSANLVSWKDMWWLCHEVDFSFQWGKSQIWKKNKYMNTKKWYIVLYCLWCIRKITD